MIDLEAIERVEKLFNEMSQKTEELLSKLEAAPKPENVKVEELISKCQEALKVENLEEKDKVLSEVEDFLKNLLKYYPFPQYTADENSSSSSEAEAYEAELAEKIVELEKENEALKEQLKAIEAENLFKERVVKLSEANPDKNWSEMRDLVLKMNESEFDTFLKSIQKINHSVIPEEEKSEKSVFTRMKESLREVKI